MLRDEIARVINETLLSSEVEIVGLPQDAADAVLALLWERAVGRFFDSDLWRLIGAAPDAPPGGWWLLDLGEEQQNDILL